MIGRMNKRTNLPLRPFRRTMAPAMLSLALLAATGCVYMHTQRPLSVNYDKTELGTKEGRSSSYSLLWLVAWGNSGTKAAANNGHIKVVDCADTEIKSVCFGLYTRVTTVVYGN